MYKALFEQWGFNSKIVEFSQLHWDDSKKALFDNDQPVDFIYNRYCDFLLQKEVSNHLLNGFSHNVTLSPNPVHYFLLADKERLLELSDPLWAEKMLDQKALSLYEKIKDNLILTYPIHSFTSREDLWEKRKNLFFKPKRSHGGKATYRGKNITKKVFDSFNDQDFLVQQFVPAPEAQFEDGKWKYELRFFVYQDTIQLVSPRFYNGQVMNFNLSGGGFGRVEFT